jgi:hypothetical protein
MSVHDITVDDTGDWMYSILRSEAFSKLPPASFKKIFMRMEVVSVKAEDIILRQGLEFYQFQAACLSCKSCA